MNRLAPPKRLIFGYVILMTFFSKMAETEFPNFVSVQAQSSNQKKKKCKKK
jgi:hypothetical protein